MKYNTIECPDTCWILNYYYFKTSKNKINYFWTFIDFADNELAEDRTYEDVAILNENNEFKAKLDDRIYIVNIDTGCATRYE